MGQRIGPDDFELVLCQVMRSVELWGLGVPGLGAWMAGGVVVLDGGSAVHIRVGLVSGMRLSFALMRDFASMKNITEVGSVWLVGRGHGTWRALWGDRHPGARIAI